MFTAHKHNGKPAEEIFSATRSPEDAYEYENRRKKFIEHSRTMKTNPFGGQKTTMAKQEAIHYINSRGSKKYANNQNSQKVGSDFEANHIHVGHKTQMVYNHDLQTLTRKSIVKSVATTLVQITYSRVQQRTKFAQNAPSGANLQKYVDLQTSFTWETELMKNKRKKKLRSKKQITTQSHLQNLHQKTVGNGLK